MKESSSVARTSRDWAALAWRAKFQAADLARRAGMVPRTLRRHFRKQFRTTPQRWLDRLRLREAARLLRAGKRTKEVAYALHYKQPSHFCRQFKERYGRSPQAWCLAKKAKRIQDGALVFGCDQSFAERRRYSVRSNPKRS